ncbi:helix-turn-helix domain-containing protein [Salegentibacter sp. Hel_I_6]|uniref:helix-turn-helix domain-containing protein n=1 Tax=Salegentibacter sp. Hel_I_6 TaxID=1250278 RepID=UPI00056123FC|nr:helix-turn-helix domain-containing protein [Salegentibacter sp. Hel_I_6]
MEGNIQFIQITPQQLQEQILAGVKIQLEELKKDFQPKTPEEYLSRKETAALLKVNLSTLHAWANKGTITPFGINGRVYFKRSEIENVLTPLK